MVKVLDSAVGARVVIASDDHCPPHVHSHHKAEGWIVRLWFAFESDAVGVLSIAPTERAVRQWQLNQMLDEMATHLGVLRRVWWDSQGTTCLENRWMVRQSQARWAVAVEERPGAKQARSAVYEAAREITTVTFSDGTKVDIGHGGIT